MRWARFNKIMLSIRKNCDLAHRAKFFVRGRPGTEILQEYGIIVSNTSSKAADFARRQTIVANVARIHGLYAVSL